MRSLRYGRDDSAVVDWGDSAVVDWDDSAVVDWDDSVAAGQTGTQTCHPERSRRIS